MLRFHIRSRFGVTSTSNDRPIKKKFSPARSAPPLSTSASTNCHPQFDTLPARQPNGHAIQYAAYAPSRFYASVAHRTPRRPRNSPGAFLGPRPCENNSYLHLQFGSSNSAPPNPTASSVDYYDPHASVKLGDLDAANSPNNTLQENHSIEHAIRLKSTALRRCLSVADELGDLSTLKQVVASHRDALARVRKSRHTALVHLHDATTLTGLPPPVTAVAPPMHGTFRRPTPIRAQPNMTTAHHHHHHHHHIRSAPVPIPRYYHRHYQQQQKRNQKKKQHQRTLDMKQLSHAVVEANKERHAQQIDELKKSSTFVRRVPGQPARRSPRTRSSFRGLRTTSTPTGRDNENSSSTPSTPPEPFPLSSVGGGWSQTKHDQPRRKYLSMLSRKSSGTLRRLSSAGSLLLRRMGRTSVDDEHTSLSSVPNGGGDMNSVGVLEGMDESTVTAVEMSVAVAAAMGVSSNTLDKKTFARLRTEPAEVVAELEAEAKRTHVEERDLLSRLNAAKRALEQRRDVHNKAMAILDQFYGSLPGWQQDPITQAMFVETVDMTDAGLETERDLAEARHSMSQAYAAMKDHELSLSALQSIGEQLGMFVSGLERLLRSVVDCDSGFEAAIYSTVRQLEKHLSNCMGSAQMAVECSVNAPRLAQIEKDMKLLHVNFGHGAKAVMNAGSMTEHDMRVHLQVGKALNVERKLSEKFVQERLKMIEEDLEQFEEMVEKCEGYVIMERVALVDLHHPEDR